MLGLKCMNIDKTITGCSLSGRPLARGNWKLWWAIGRHVNSPPPGE